MEAIGVITKVTVPSSWCTGMVVVPKSNGTVRICVDLRPLNESVLREPHHVPTVNETLAQLSGAAVFSKVDANSGFWQIPLSEQSQPYTTFISPFGCYCFHGPGDQTRSQPFHEYRWNCHNQQYWLCTIPVHPSRFQQMPHLMDWGQSFFSGLRPSGGQYRMCHGQWQRLSNATLRSRRRPWQLHGCVKNSQFIYKGENSKLSRITNLWSLC